MSLRARLIAVLLAVSAAGLLLLAGITYALLRSYELERVDDQARSAVPLMARALDDEDLGPGPQRGPGGGPPPDRSLPPGTYGERRAADGTRSTASRSPSAVPLHRCRASRLSWSRAPR